MFNTNPNPFWFLVMMVITVFIVIMSCANVAHSFDNFGNSHQTYYYDNYYQQGYPERHHVPKRIRYHVQERYYVNYELCRIHHKHHICRERHGRDFRYGNERPLTPRERHMRNKVIREGGEW